MNLKYLQYKGYIGTIEVDLASDTFYGRLLYLSEKIEYRLEPYFPGCGGLEEGFQRAVDDYLDTCAREGRTPEKPCRGSIDVTLHPELHAAALNFARERDIDISQVVSLALSRMLGPDNPNLLPSDHYLRHTQTVRPQAVGIRAIS